MDQGKSSEGAKLWGGRFSGKTDPVMESFNASISYDKRLWKEDLEGSVAYSKGLEKVGILSKEEAEQICKGLAQIHKEWDTDTFQLKAGDEDIHTANERRLKELIGAVGGKLHTGRSRNDQVATDVRLWLRSQIDEVRSSLVVFLNVIVSRAESDVHIIMPGYTHLQRAQPIRWSQWLMSYAWACKRDAERLDQIKDRVNTLPLGCGALAGNPFGIDREFLTQELGFLHPIPNSLDGTADRDFIIEFLFWSSLTMVHLSKLSEEMIIYNTKEFSFISLSDQYSTGSSLMPQKKNPDSLELIRGKCGTILGKLTGFMATVKATPNAYNKDLQEDKLALFEVVDTMKAVLQIAAGTMATLTVNKERCLAALSPEMLSTDVAYYLVRKGVPFRDAHCLSGEVVCLAETKEIEINTLSINDLQAISPHFAEDVNEIWNYENSTNQYTSLGGTALSAVNQQIDMFKAWLQNESE